MNSFKNFVIFVLSVIILVLSAFLIYFIKRQQPRESKISRPVVGAPVPVKIRPIKPAVPTVKPIVEPIVVRPVTGKIAIVLDDWGYNLKNKDFIVSNDFHVTLSVLPYRAFSTQVARLAYQNNKEVILHMPMEPLHKENFGLEENTLLVTMDRATIIKNLDNAFETVPFARGISNHMGSAATENTRLMKIVLEYLKKKDMFFLDSFVTPASVCRKLANSMGLAFAERQVFIDNESNPAYIREQLFKCAQKARRLNYVVGIGHDRPNTIAILKEVIPRLEAQGYRFVNLSEVIGE